MADNANTEVGIWYYSGRKVVLGGCTRIWYNLPLLYHCTSWRMRWQRTCIVVTPRLQKLLNVGRRGRLKRMRGLESLHDPARPVD